MNFVGKNVKNIKYGKGIVTKQDSSSIWVKFISREGEVKFTYPTCFKGLLKCLDMEITPEVIDSIRQCEINEHKKNEQKRNLAKKKSDVKKIKNNSFTSGKGVEVPSFDSVKSFCEKYKFALDDEILYLKMKGSKTVSVFEGKCVESNSGRFVYTFETEDELHFPDGLPIKIHLGNTYFNGNIVECVEFIVIISTNTNFGEEIRSLEFSADPWYLLESLKDRLDEISEKPTNIVYSLICEGNKFIDYNNLEITIGQNSAIKMSQSQPITFIWGPPGTGKTETLAHIALEHIKQGNSVLMLSYSNVSVDGAVMRMHKMAPECEQGVLIRYGYVINRDLLEHEYLTSYNLAISKYPKLVNKRKNLIYERKTLSRESEKYIQISSELKKIKDKLKYEEKTIVKNAKFIATTVSKAVVDELIYKRKFDVVIFDEASMAYIPQIIFSASLAKSNFVCIGDFRQLPPIVQISDKSILNADIFQYCGITTAVDIGRNHKWLCMLNTQYRMHPDISDFASYSMYGSLLKSDENMAEKRRNVVNHNPISGYAIGFVDLSGLMSVCNNTVGNSGSRINVLSAFISFAMALDAAQKYDVGIITPYRSQAVLLRAMVRDTQGYSNLKEISCATVHQFQGSEKDVIIYDAVDCYRMPYPGLPLASIQNNYANRLFNVALTRAKAKFVGVANISYMDKLPKSDKSMFKCMMEIQQGASSCLKGKEIFSNCNIDDVGLMKLFHTPYVQVMNGISIDALELYFCNDIDIARKEIQIDIPDKPLIFNEICLHLLVRIIPRAKSKGVKVSLRAENKKSLPADLIPFAIENKSVTNPVTIIDKKIVWFGMPKSDANFKPSGQVQKTIYHPVIRFEGEHTAKTLYSFLEMNKTIDQCNEVFVDNIDGKITETFSSYVLANEVCPYCAEPMKLRKRKTGSYFLSCTGYPKCKGGLNITEVLVKKYLYRNGGQLCEQCGSQMDAKSGKYGVYVQCFGRNAHRYNLDEI